MIHTRESIYAALFSRVSTAALFKTIGRRYKPFTEIAPADQPALFQVQRKEESQTQTGQPTIWKFHVDLVIYVNSGNEMDTVVSSLMNPILDAVTGLFDPDASTNFGKQTLGGLVHYARVSGPIETDEGVLDRPAYAIIPIEILPL
jgi:hypothetical protein